MTIELLEVAVASPGTDLTSIARIRGVVGAILSRLGKLVPPILVAGPFAVGIEVTDDHAVPMPPGEILVRKARSVVTPVRLHGPVTDRGIGVLVGVAELHEQYVLRRLERAHLPAFDVLRGRRIGKTTKRVDRAVHEIVNDVERVRLIDGHARTRTFVNVVGLQVRPETALL